MRHVFNALLLGILVCVTVPAFAHHPGHGSAPSATRALIYQGSRTKPGSRVFLSVDAAQLDNAVGQTHSGILGGEYALTDRISIGGSVPLTHIAYNARAVATGIGDVTLQGKFLLWNTEASFGYASSLWSFPTGNEHNGTGRGAVAQQADVFAGRHIGDWTLFGTTGINFGYESDSEPVLALGAGLTTPRVLNERVYASLGLNGQIFLHSDVFTSGSSKLYVEPQIHCFLDGEDRLLLSLAGRISAIDELETRAGVAITRADSVLLTDVLYGGSLSLNYQF